MIHGFWKKNKWIRLTALLVLAIMLISDICGSAAASVSMAAAADTDIMQEQTTAEEQSVQTTDNTAGSGDVSLSGTPIVKSDRELRGIWVACVDYFTLGMTNADKDTYRKKVAKFVSDAKKLKCNAIFLHVRSFDDAIWPSKNFKASSWLSGSVNSKKLAYKVYKKYDPLKVFIEEAHKQGLELHAYMNPFRVTKTVYLDPGAESSQKRVLTAIKEVCKYDVDGIHFDDYFYHANKYIKTEKPKKQYKINITAAKKRENVNKLLKKIYKEVHKHGNVVFGIAPQGNYGNDMNSGADVKSWLSKTGFVDYVCPQIYWSDKYGDGTQKLFTERLTEFKKIHTNKAVKFYVGLALCRGGGGDSVAPGDPGWKLSCVNIRNQVKKLRKKGAGGYILFSAKWIYTKSTKKERKKLLEYLEETEE